MCIRDRFAGRYAYVTSYAGPVEINPNYEQIGYVAVTPPANATLGLGELRLQGTDENGLVYLAIARVSVKGSGFADPAGRCV